MGIGLAASSLIPAPARAALCASSSNTPKTSVERLYILHSGDALVKDRSMYSPGVHVGEEASLSCYAYLIKRVDGWTLWDTGIEDAVAEEPEGKVIAHDIRGVVRHTMALQLQAIGITPADIDTLLISHAHFDHIGNCRMFPQATWIAQRAEYEAMFGPDHEEYGFLPDLYQTLKSNPVRIVDGDHDVHRDGSVQLISTPGHTPGHCSLLVRLPQTGAVILSGDVAHFAESLPNRYVPKMNADPKASRASMDRIEALSRRERAPIWFNHDAEAMGTLPQAPNWVS